MPAKQLFNTLYQILENKHVNKTKALSKHILWQIRKILKLYPFEIKISNFIIIVEDKNCGGCALANSMEMYDYNIMNLIKLLSKKENVFFDVGANVGIYSLIAAEENTVVVYSFEPHPKTFSQLYKNIEINGLENIIPLKLALSNTEGRSGFSDFAESSVNRFVKTGFEPRIIVNKKRGDEICKEFNVVPSLLKIDVEGFELDVLKGFGEYLSHVKFIIVEFGELNNRDAMEIVELCNNKNFEGPFYFNYDGRLFTREIIKGENNVVFVNREIIKHLSGIYGLQIR